MLTLLKHAYSTRLKSSKHAKISAFIFLVHYEWENKLESYIPLGMKGFSGDKCPSSFGPFISYKEDKVL